MAIAELRDLLVRAENEGLSYVVRGKSRAAFPELLLS